MQTKGVLELTEYYRKFIKNFAKISKPLSELTKKDTPFHWTDAQQIAFDTLKHKLCQQNIHASN